MHTSQCMGEKKKRGPTNSQTNSAPVTEALCIQKGLGEKKNQSCRISKTIVISETWYFISFSFPCHLTSIHFPWCLCERCVWSPLSSKPIRQILRPRSLIHLSVLVPTASFPHLPVRSGSCSLVPWFTCSFQFLRSRSSIHLSVVVPAASFTSLTCPFVLLDWTGSAALPACLSLLSQLEVLCLMDHWQGDMVVQMLHMWAISPGHLTLFFSWASPRDLPQET